MKIHYFQRYHGKENVATANTMLLLSRLYSYSSDKFYRFLKSEFFSESFSPEIEFNLQEKSVNSVPDAIIKQDSFKIVVETKLEDWFYKEQLINHLQSFNDENYKVLLTLASQPMQEDKKIDFEKELNEFNGKVKGKPIIHKNATFEQLTNAIGEILDDRDYEMHDVLDDYMDYCYNDKLITNSDSWKFMRMQLAGATFDFNVKESLYYDKAERGFREHDILGLYTKKSVRAIGKLTAIIQAEMENNELKIISCERGEVTKERETSIRKAMEEAENRGWDIKNYSHNYFFVEKFYETDFKKISSGPSMGTRIFDLSQLLNVNKKEFPEIEDLAEILKNKTWS